jgi:hypothetical protein
MANPTNPFNWQMPTSTDLVTDLPADFEVFGQAVATSMADLLGGTTGQVLSKASNTNMDFTWVTTDDANAIQNSIVDAKGDLIGATANDTPARLAVGGNNAFLRANSSAATGLEWAGAYTSFTPTSGGNWTLGNGSVMGRYIQIGKLVSFFGSFTLGSTSTITGGMYVNYPVAGDTTYNNQPIGHGRYTDAGVGTYPGQVIQANGDGFLLTIGNAGATYVFEDYFSSTKPFTWTTNDVVYFSGIYVAA